MTEADLPELPDDAILEMAEKKKPTPAPIEDLPDDVEMLEELPADSEPIVEEPPKPKPVPAKKPAPKPAPKPAAKAPVAEPAPQKVAPPKPVAKKPKPKPAAVAPATAGTPDGGEKQKLSAEEREKQKAERAAARKAELDRAAGKTGEKRELDEAPLVLRKASLIMGAAAIIPFATVPMQLWPMIFVGKALILLGGWIFYQSHVHHHEPAKAPGFVASLAKSGPAAVWGVFGVLALAGLWNFANVDALAEPLSLNGNHLLLIKAAILAEKLVLLLCLFTYTHIYDYEHGGKFNPIFPLMYLGGAIMGIGAVFNDIATPSGTKLEPNYIAALGAVGVAIGGCMAMWTMYLAMKEAKAHGERKKAAAAEARKAAREARRRK